MVVRTLHTENIYVLQDTTEFYVKMAQDSLNLEDFSDNLT